MRIVFRAATTTDLRWFRRYYSVVFTEGERRAREQYLRAYKALLSHPEIGRAVEGAAPMRELQIPRTPFSFIYFLQGEEIVITRILDNRAERPASLSS